MDVEKWMGLTVWGKIDSKKVKVSDKHFVEVSLISTVSFLNGIEILAAHMDPWLEITLPRFSCS